MVEVVSCLEKFEVMFDYSLFLGRAEETDEPDPGGGCAGGGEETGNSSGSEGNKENSISSSKLLLSRRQKKNRIRKEGEDISPPISKKMTRKSSSSSSSSSSTSSSSSSSSPSSPSMTTAETYSKKSNSKTFNTYFRTHFKSASLDDGELFNFLRNYLLTPDQVVGLGYPIESSLHPGRAIIYKAGSYVSRNTFDNSVQLETSPRSNHFFDVNAREFVPSSGAGIPKRKTHPDLSDQVEAITRNQCERNEIGDSLESSESTSSKSSDKSEEEEEEEDDDDDDDDEDEEEEEEEEEELPEAEVTSFETDSVKANGVRTENETSPEPQTRRIIQRILKRCQTGSDEKKCARCGRGFFVMVDGEYLTQEKCVYHWGKLRRVSATNSVSFKSEFSCCKGRKNSRGCSTAKFHVWSGVAAGVNGPFEGYVKTKPRKTRPSDGNYGVYSMDCEMCYTIQGLELTKISIVGTDGRTVYDTFVKPENAIIDYNTRFSGITAKDLAGGNTAKTLKEVQNDLAGFINSETILIGHSLESDLKALKMIHSSVIDTSVIFPHYYGLPFRRSLKSLANCFLKREIQCCGHDSLEDARACMELMLWRVKKDLRNGHDGRRDRALLDKF